jgi:hypothetical protein
VSSRSLPLTPTSRARLARRVDHATVGLRAGYLGVGEYSKLVKLATRMATVETRRWWMPRPDQPWRYD